MVKFNHLIINCWWVHPFLVPTILLSKTFWLTSLIITIKIKKKNLTNGVIDFSVASNSVLAFPFSA